MSSGESTSDRAKGQVTSAISWTIAITIAWAISFCRVNNNRNGNCVDDRDSFLCSEWKLQLQPPKWVENPIPNYSYSSIQKKIIINIEM